MARLKGAWSKSNQGPRSKKNGGNEESKNFKPEKTWNKNPQFRVWLTDPDDKDVKHEQVQPTLTRTFNPNRPRR